MQGLGMMDWSSVSAAASAVWALFRLFVGVLFILHGSSKLFGGQPGLKGFSGWLGSMGVPAPAVAAVLSALAEFGGGILLVLGLLVPVAGLALVVNMAVAAFVANRSKGLIGGNEFDLVLLGAALLFAFFGAGPFSLSQYLFVPGVWL